MQFVDTTTPTMQEYQNQAVDYDIPKGTTGSRTRQRAADWQAMYYQNAYNTALLNYQNEYNSPLQQMLRYQEAGLNPFLVGQDPGNMSGAPGGAVPRGSNMRPMSEADTASIIFGGINGVNQVLNSAKTIYDYLTFGRPLQELNLQQGNITLKTLQEKLVSATAEADWNMYWNYGPGMGPNSPYVQGSPRAVYMENSTQRLAAQIDQLEGLVNVLYPSQADANSASAALNDYKKQILEGQNDAILNINTGNATADSILKTLLMWLSRKISF